MRLKPLPLLVSGALLALASGVQAADTYFDNFTPLASSVPAGSLPESAPFALSSPNFSQKLVVDVNTQLAAGQANPGDWDMIDSNRTGPDAGRYLFNPFEKFDTTNPQAGVQRTDLWLGVTKTIVQPGTQGFVAGDASRWTPWGGYLTAEESWNANGTATGHKGRVFEVTNPLADPASINFVHRNVLPRTSHEGLVFDKDNNLYFIDEYNGGSIYKYVSTNPNAGNGNDFFNAGQTFVLKTVSGTTQGSFVWEAITTATGTPLATTAAAMLNVGNGQFAMDGRAAADLVGGTNYYRPEDMEILTMPNGDQKIFLATTTNHEVYTIDLATSEIKIFVDRNTIDLATGLAVGSAFKNPDNIAIDHAGNVYIVEDQPGGLADIWLAQDADKDGVAESIGRWASMSTVGAEPSGLYFDVNDPNVAYVHVMHPDSGNDVMIQISAVPEPETYAMMLAGLGLIGFIARRRKAD